MEIEMYEVDDDGKCVECGVLVGGGDKTTLESFFEATRMLSFTWDTLEEAERAASLILKGSDSLKCIFIVAAEDDAPEAAIDAAGPCVLFVRARNLISGNWRLVTRSTDPAPSSHTSEAS
jgi:hypothetical protein